MRLIRKLGIVGLFCLLVFTFVPGFVSQAQDSRKKQVLVLHSYHRGYKWTDDIMRGIESAFRVKKEDIDLQVEYMDTKRIFDEQYLLRMYEVYKYKFSGRKFDVIISSDDNAFNFLLKYRDELFPDTPVVFCGVNFFRDSVLVGYDRFTGVNEEADVKGGLDIALKLHPNTERIVIVNDTTTTGLKVHERIMEVIPAYQESVEFVFLEDVDMAEIQARVQELPPDSLVYYTLFFRDKSDRFFEYDESISLIAEKSNVPIYGTWDFSLGYGIVGGMLTSGYYQGEMAARLAIRVLDGERIEDISVVRESPNRYMFDYDQMQRFGLKQSDLPKGSEVINRPFSFYSEYRTLVWIVIASIAGLAVIIFALLTNIFRRQRVEEELRKYQEHLEELVEERTAELVHATRQAQEARAAAEAANQAKSAFLQQVQKEKKRANDLLGVVIPLGVALSAERDFDRLLEKIVLEAKSFCDADAGTLYLCAEDGRLEFVIVRNDSLNMAMGGTSGQEVSFPPLHLYDERTGEPNHQNIVTLAALTGTSVSIPDAYQTEGFDFPGTRAFDAKTGYRSTSFLTLPLKDSLKRVIGVLQLINAQDPETSQVIPFDKGLQQMVESMSLLAAVALEAYIRERSLRQEIQQLHIELDEAKQAHQVAEIIETEYFQQLKARATSLRGNMEGKSE